MIDAQGFRANIGIILTNQQGKVFWAKRIGQQSWQFPQGGIHQGEDTRTALFRELEEEVGLRSEHVEIVGSTRNWLRYRLPRRYIRHHRRPLCIGQKQKWFMLKLVAPESRVRFDITAKPEFDNYRWVDYWFPLQEVVFFKRQVYRRALGELAGLLKSAAHC